MMQNWTKAYHINRVSITNPSRVKTEVILSKFPMTINESFKFKNTMMNNYANIVDLSIPINGRCPNGDKITIVTSQLDGLLHYSAYRKDQFYSLINLISENNNIFFLGDTNFTDAGEDVIEIPEHWQDVWIQLDKPTETEYTVDSEKNSYLTGHRQYRFDRVIYKSRNWTASKLEFIGTESITDSEKNPVYPSDHFGLYVEFVQT